MFLQIKAYPRTSIDNAKSVRQNSHAVHGHIAVSAGKRFAKYMPRSVAAWLSGLYDSDRSVVEATQASLRQVFNTAEKLQNIRKAYQQPILEYCQDAINKESPATLSDTNTVSKDDAQLKYSRVISACISLLGSLLANLQPEELSKYQKDYDDLFGNKALWDFASSDDGSIRRSVHRLLRTCLQKDPEIIEANQEIISKSYLSVALNSDQLGSIYDYIEALTSLTSTYPLVWTQHYKSKTAVERRLRQFLKKGSQLGPRDYWSQLTRLFKLIPAEVLPSTSTDAEELLGAFHSGIVRNDEIKINHAAAFDSYLEVTRTIIQRLPDEDQSKLLEKAVSPLLEQFLQPSTETAQWTIPPGVAAELIAKATGMSAMASILKERIPRFSQSLIDDIRTSAPEQSKDFERSQAAAIQHATRFATLQNIIFKNNDLAAVHPLLSETRATIIDEAINITKNRNGKPYSAAGTIVVMLPPSTSTAGLTTDSKKKIEQFSHDDIPRLLTTPSATYLIDVLYSISDTQDFGEAWTSALKVLLQESDSPSKTKALNSMLNSKKIPPSFDLATSDSGLQAYVKDTVREAVDGLGEWDSFNHILQAQNKTKIMTTETTVDVLTYMTESLSMNDRAQSSLQGIRQVVKSNPSLLKEFVSSPAGGKLLQILLLASESPNDEIAQGAAAVNASIQTLLASGSDTAQSMFDLIQQGLREASLTSVSIETLVDLAKQSIKAGSGWDEIARVLPSADSWNQALAPFLDTPPKSSLAITNPLTGAVYLVSSNTSTTTAQSLSRDADGYSSAYRIAQYVTKLFKHAESFPIDKAPKEFQTAYLRNIAVTVQLADDNLGLAGSNGLWTHYNHDVETDAMAFMSDAQSLVKQEVTRITQTWSPDGTDPSVLSWIVDLWSDIASDSSPVAYYHARAYGVVVADAVEMSGWKTSQTKQLQDMLKAMRKLEGPFPLLAFLHALTEPLAASKSCERMCNEIIADLTGLDIQQKPREGLHQLVLLNSLLGQDGIADSIAKQRLIFFVKHVIPWLEDREVFRKIKAELCRVLTALLPIMSDMYGEHWSNILRSLATAWSSTQELEENESGMDRYVRVSTSIMSSLTLYSPIAFTHASLKLYAKLRTLTEIEEPNDDLLDAWKETSQDIANGLLNLLKHSQHFPDEFHQPLKMVNDVLARQISKVSLKQLESAEELFSLLYVESQNVQQTAFDILHKQIAATQEQISIDAALEKKTARLPEELLSLIIDAPTMAALAEVNFERSIPLPLRGYLFSWLLVFDHLEHASFKVKNDYIDHVKEGDYLPGLLNFTFDFLGHARNKPFTDVAKFDITVYEPGLEDPVRDLQWLLIHLYFLSLRHIPSLTKTWFIDCKSRATVVTLEPWTEKFVSGPLLFHLSE